MIIKYDYKNMILKKIMIKTLINDSTYDLIDTPLIDTP